MKPRNPENHPLKVIMRCKKQGRVAHIAAPMVRYSKLPFRALIRHYNVDIVYSPMMLAREFVRNQTARVCDFTTNDEDTCLIVQLGANNVTDAVRAAELLQNYTDGVGLNCGCPIKEQVREGIGAALMKNADLVADMVRGIKDHCGKDFCVEVKTRIHKDLNMTIEFVRKAEAAGADFITIHGRFQSQRSTTPPDLDAIRVIKESVTIPVMANGDAFTMDDVNKMAEITKCDGVMSARGLLVNPALFAGFTATPVEAIWKFWNYVTAYGLPFRLTQHHFSEMTDGLITKQDRKALNDCTTLVELLDWFETEFPLACDRYNEQKLANLNLKKSG